MGIVDYAVSFTLAGSGVALAAPFLEQKVPQVAPFANSVRSHRKVFGIFGMVGGAIGLIAIPLLILLAVGLGGLFENLLLLVAAFLELVGCVLTIGVGFMVLRGESAPGEAHSGQLDLPTIVGFTGIAYGAFMALLMTVAQAVA